MYTLGHSYLYVWVKDYLAQAVLPIAVNQIFPSPWQLLVIPILSSWYTNYSYSLILIYMYYIMYYKAQEQKCTYS